MEGEAMMKVDDKLLSEIREKVAGKTNGDLFVSVRQQVNAYKLYRRFWKMERYGVEGEGSYLDGAYRFLNSSVEAEFIVFCSKFEHMEPMEYLSKLTGTSKKAKG